MSVATLLGAPVAERVLLGDEALAQGALDAGISAAFAYPGTPSTEIMESLLAPGREGRRPKGGWCANEKTAYEAALGVSMAGRRALVAMKHVGLNVAADAFVNSAVVHVHGGLVVAVADDPGMHSSQNEQDTRVLAEFAHAICLEPSDQQETYAMTREAFELSERFGLPVVVRLVTRLAHSRSAVTLSAPRAENPTQKDPAGARSWVLLPGNARRLWKERLAQHDELVRWADASGLDTLELADHPGGLGVITAGIGKQHFLEVVDELPIRPSHLHVATYPLPVALLRKLATYCPRLLVIEEGSPFVERRLQHLLPMRRSVDGRDTGRIPPDGELSPDVVRAALGLPAREHPAFATPLPGRPPQLCQGCPHRDTYAALRLALADRGEGVVAGDIGCYTLGALPPFAALESCVCMGASIGMARGAAAAGLRPAVACIGDSTFLHSGVPALMDAVAEDADMTVLVLDNEAVGMTGGQVPALPDSRLLPIVLGVGVDPAHAHVIAAHPSRVDAMADVIRRELDHRGLSVIVAVRQCLPAQKKQRGQDVPE
ncbi:MAG: indolepyruvate ferredoxin oxidoreductase [Planctomycetes bacterium]|nr:indolepyruvate ferredoxin oxidoreductase [Planctomycetota bacterium]